MLGHAELDEDHISLIQLMVRLDVSSEPDMGTVCHTLFDKWVLHDSKELAVMRRIGFPYIDYHSKQHATIVGQFALAISYCDEDKPYVLNNPVSVLKNMLFEHLDQQDQQLIAFLGLDNENPVARKAP